MTSSDIEALDSLNDRLLREAEERVQKAENGVNERKSECEAMINNAQEILQRDQGLRESIETRVGTVDRDMKTAIAKFDGKVEAVRIKINQRNYLWNKAATHFENYQRLLAEIRGYENVSSNPNGAPASRMGAAIAISRLKAQAAEQLAMAEANNDAAHKVDAEIPRLDAEVAKFKAEADRLKVLLEKTTAMLKDAMAQEATSRTKAEEAKTLGESKVAEASNLLNTAQAQRSEQQSMHDTNHSKYMESLAALRRYFEGR